MIMGCHHIGILTRNPDIVIPFYTRGLGFDEGETRILPAELMEKIFGLASECRLTRLTKNRAVIEVFFPADSDVNDRKLCTMGYNHRALEVEDKEAYVHDLEDRHVPVMKIDHGGRTIFFLKDPEGNLIEIYESK